MSNAFGDYEQVLFFFRKTRMNAARGVSRNKIRRGRGENSVSERGEN